MHLMLLGLVNALISVVHQLSTLFDMKNELSSRVKTSMEQLAESGIDFAPKEILINDKTTG